MIAESQYESWNRWHVPASPEGGEIRVTAGACP